MMSPHPCLPFGRHRLHAGPACRTAAHAHTPAWSVRPLTLPNARQTEDPAAMTRQHRIASIPADGIGPEVISAGLEVLDAVAARDGGFTVTIDHYDWGS